LISLISESVKMNFKLLFQIALLLIFSIIKVSSEDSDILMVTIDNGVDNNREYNSTSYDSITATMKKYLVSYIYNYWIFFFKKFYKNTI